MWKFFALSFVVVLILGGCESDQTTTNSGRVSPRLNKSVDTAPTVVSVKVVSDFQRTATANAKYNASRNSLPKSDISGNSATASARAEAQRGADRNRGEVPSCFPNCPTQVPTVIQLPPATAAPTSDPSPTIPLPTAMARPTMTSDELFEWALAMNTVTSATQTAMQKHVSGGQVISIDEHGPTFDLYDRKEWSPCDDIELDRCVTIEFQDSKTWVTHQITTPVWGDCYDDARSKRYVSSRGPCGEYWSTLWKPNW